MGQERQVDKSSLVLKTSDKESAALREKVVEIVARVLGEQYEPRQLRLELTSLKMLELIVALEDELGIHISAAGECRYQTEPITMMHDLREESPDALQFS